MIRKRQIFYFLMFFIILVLWIYSGIRHAFDDDEFQHMHIAWLFSHGATPYVDFFEHHLVLYHRIMSVFFYLGDALFLVFVFRAFSIFCAFGTFFLLYRCGREMGVSVSASATGVFLLAIVPIFILKMTEARPEAPAIFFLALLVKMLLTGVKKPSLPSSKMEGLNSILFGGLLALISLLSQKYVITAGVIFAVLFFVRGWRATIFAISAFLVAIFAYCLWMLALGAGSSAFDSVILMNIRWRYSFSSSLYFSELFLSAGPLLATGVFGILMSFAEGRRRRIAFVLFVLLLGLLLQVFLVPVPFRQAFLPFLLILALGSMLFCASLFRFLEKTHHENLLLVLPFFFASSSFLSLSEQLKSDNVSDIKNINMFAKFADNTVFFDGRGLMFFRPHLGYYACMHKGIQMMLDTEKYANETISALSLAGFPPVLYDYRVKMMPAPIRSFISENYIESEIPGLLVVGGRIDRIPPRLVAKLRIKTSGNWCFSWKGEDLRLDARILKNGETISLEKGDYNLASESLIWDFKFEKKY